MLLVLVLLLSIGSGVGLCFLTDGFESLHWLWQLPLGFVGGFLVSAALAFGVLILICNSIDPEKPREKDSPWFRTMVLWYIHAILTVLPIKIKKRGMEKFQVEGRFLLVCNHLDNIDPAFLLTCFRKSQLAFISKREVQEYFLAGEMMHKLLCQPINRENDREALKTILKCIQIIKEDKASVAVFPEGYIHDDKKLHRFRPGAFKIATKTKVPIVVCTMRGTTDVLSSFKHLKSSTVDVRLLQVIQPEEYENITTVELSDRIYQTMAQDLGPELVSQEENA